MPAPTAIQLVEYRLQAEKCRAFAEKSLNEAEKEAWRKMERAWLELAGRLQSETPPYSGGKRYMHRG